ncbi:hypothetical protein C7974DRAFT_396096 [Boeremia exigua]|uniref:uncharacterized protein n=1 Tax=Boeremia exigua TaxID=749465 RepID=UPI001E8D870C|nr:uncharacterized protein C7974DRAFT_396096 [Boeremia exigua]KAH6625441.1 hypothetical protein C7974DRAFT_396096 [Boeremia exigua]
METISNIASTATTTVSNLIYGSPDAAKTNETAGKEPVSGVTGKGTADEPYDQGNSESALEKNTTAGTSTTVEPTGSTQSPEDLLKAYKNEAGTSTSTTAGTSNTVEPTSSTQKPEDLIKAYKSEATGVDVVKPSGTDPVVPATGFGAQDSIDSSGKDTLWRGVDAYKDTSSTEPATTAIKPLAGESTTSGPKGAVDPEPKNYSIGDLTTGKETPPKPVGETSAATATATTTTATESDSKTGIVGERAGHGGPATAIEEDKKSSSVSPTRDDDEKSGKMDKLKDKLKTKLHIGSKDH